MSSEALSCEAMKRKLREMLPSDREEFLRYIAQKLARDAAWAAAEVSVWDATWDAAEVSALDKDGEP